MQRYKYSGDFLLDDDAIKFIDDIPSNDRFGPFGMDGNGSVFAVWSGCETPLCSDGLEEQPIVYLDSEAVFSTVLASSFESFLLLLTLNIEGLGIRAARGLELNRLESNDESEEFRRWVQGIVGSKLPDSGTAIVHDSKRRFQRSFRAWFEAWQGEPPWSHMAEDT